MLNRSMPGKFAGTLAVIGIAIFLALVTLLLSHAPQLKSQLWDQSDPWWLTGYAAATIIAGLMVWFRQGKVLLGCAVVAMTVLLLTPAFCGAMGWALPKLLISSLIAIGVGERVIRWLLPSVSLPYLDRWLLDAALGFGLLSLVMLALGLLQLWSPSVIAAVFLVLAIAIARDLTGLWRETIAGGIRPLLSRWPDADLRLPALAAASLCICSFGCYLGAVAPNAHWDVLHYHLGIPTIYVARGGFVPLDHTFAVHLVRNAEMLYSMGLLLEGQPLPTLFNFLFGLIGAGLVLSLGTLLADRRVGYLACSFFFAVPLVSYVLTEGLIDVIPTTYIVAATYAFFRWQRDGNSRWIALFSLLAGLAVSTKLNAAVFLSPLAAVMLIKSVYVAPRWRQRFLCGLRLLVPGALVLAPWLAVTWFRTGNPFFPFLNNLFQSPQWYHDSIVDGVDWKGFGTGHNWWYALRLPWDLAFSGDRFGELGWFSTGGIVLFGLPFSYFAAPRYQRPAMRWLTMVVVFSLAVFFGLVQYARYMLPLTALCAIIAAMNCTSAWAMLSRIPRIRWLPLGACVVIALGWLFFSRAVHVSTQSHFMPGRYPWRFALGRQSADECLRHSSLSEYPYLTFVKEQLSEKPVVLLGIGLGSGVYSGDAIEYSRWHSLSGKQMVEERSAHRLLELFNEKRVRYLAINEGYVQHNPWWRDVMREAAALSPNFYREFCEPLFGSNGVVLYQLRPEGIDASAGRQPRSLVESDLKPGANGDLYDWGIAAGQLRHLPPGSHPFQPDAHVVGVSEGDCICRRCEIRENTLYTLSAEFWSSESQQTSWLQIQWHDASGNPIKDEVAEHEVGSLPNRFAISRTSPPGAAACVVYLRAGKASNVCMARPQLVESTQVAVRQQSSQHSIAKRH